MLSTTLKRLLWLLKLQEDFLVVLQFSFYFEYLQRPVETLDSVDPSPATCGGNIWVSGQHMHASSRQASGEEGRVDQQDNHEGTIERWVRQQATRDYRDTLHQRWWDGEVC